MLVRRVVFGLIALSALVYLLFRTPEPVVGEAQLVEQQFPAMGTWFTVSVWLDDAALRDEATAAISDIEAQLHAYARQWSPLGDGEMAEFNRQLDAGERAEIPDEMRPLFERAARWRADTDGAFDARIGGLVALWGFDSEENFREAPPPDDAIDTLRRQLAAAPDYDGGDGYGPAEGIRWNLGAIAKGNALQQSSQTLYDAGFTNHIINGGGDLTVRGERGERQWRVAIRNPRPGNGHSLLAALDVADEAVFTSGDYERSFEFEGRRFHHVLDPDTGYPAEGMRSVTVVHADPEIADAASTALFVAGADWRGLAERLGVDTVLVVDGDGYLDMTDAADARFRIVAQLPRLARD